jgi:hypothetical protein
VVPGVPDFLVGRVCLENNVCRISVILVGVVLRKIVQYREYSGAVAQTLEFRIGHTDIETLYASSTLVLWRYLMRASAIFCQSQSEYSGVVHRLY